MEVLFYLAIAMFAGLLMTRLTRLVKLPNVTAYLIAGVLIGPCVFALLKDETVSSLGLITSTALGFIAFSIGDQFKLSDLKAIGKTALVITMCESLGAVILVDVITLALGFDPAMCIVLGALAASTAPAATLLVVRQYKASGPLTNMLLPVVAADDATGLIAYSISVSIAQGIANHQQFSVTDTLLVPLGQIILALGIGAALGFLIALSHRWFKSHTNRMSLCIAAIFLSVAISDRFRLSSLLMCMALGAVYVNMRDDAERVLGFIDDWTYPLFMLFFVISGAQLDLGSLPKVGLLGVVYIIVRFAGKYFGSYLAASACHCEPAVKKGIGWALMPQAGVAIGMATLAVTQLPQYGDQILTVILSATLFYEIAGPIATKDALKRAGEIRSE